MVDLMSSPPAKLLIMTPTSSGAAGPAVDPARFMKTLSMRTYSNVSHAASKCVLYTTLRGMRERHVKNMITERATQMRSISRGRRRHLLGQFLDSRRSVRGGVETVGGILRRMAGVII